MADKGHPAVLWGRDFRLIVACEGSTFEYAPRITVSLELHITEKQSSSH